MVVPDKDTLLSTLHLNISHSMSMIPTVRPGILIYTARQIAITVFGKTKTKCN
jgi:hypothetical protein